MNSSEQSLTRSYSQEDVQQILNIALAQHSSADPELSYAQLLEIAEEMHIPAATLMLAEDQWRSRQSAVSKFEEFKAERRAKFQNRLGKYAVINTCLVALNLLTGFGVPWSLYIAIFWGMSVGLDAWKLFYQRHSAADDRAFQSWQRNQKIRKLITGSIDKIVRV